MNQIGDDEAEVVEAYRAIYCGMLESDVVLLDQLLDDDYTPTHLTGYVQSKQEWLQQIETGEMRYHSSKERDTAVELDGVRATLTGRSVVDADIWGSRGTWNLQLTTTYERRASRWLALRTEAKMF